MASIVIADSTAPYDGRDLDQRLLGGTELSIIHCARELARRGHNVTVHTPCIEVVEHESVLWKPLNHPPQAGCDLYVAVQQPRLLGFVRRPKRRAIWVLWPSNQLRHYKKIGRMWRYRPVPVLESHIRWNATRASFPAAIGKLSFHSVLLTTLGGEAFLRRFLCGARSSPRFPAQSSSPRGNLGNIHSPARARRCAGRVRHQRASIWRGRLEIVEGGVLPYGLPQYVKDPSGFILRSVAKSHRGDASLPNDPVSWSQVRSVLPVTR